jgi:FkbM family methyltransferase
MTDHQHSPPEVCKIATRYGAMVAPDAETDMIGIFLRRYGEWAFAETRFIASNMPVGGLLLDVGAFIGTFGIGVSQEAQLTKICFVEANPAALPYLETNVARNSRCPNSIVGAMAGSGAFAARSGRSKPGNLSSYSFVTPSTLAEEQADRTFVSLQALIVDHGPFDLIKIDAEGTEFDILCSGMSAVLATGATLWLECNETVEALHLVDYVLGAGLYVFFVACPAFNPSNFRGDPDPIFPFAFEAGLYCTARPIPPHLEEPLRLAGCFIKPVTSVDDVKRALWLTPRGGPRDWIALSRDQIVALAVRSMRGEAYDQFLEEFGPK